MISLSGIHVASAETASAGSGVATGWVMVARRGYDEPGVFYNEDGVTSVASLRACDAAASFGCSWAASSAAARAV